MEQNFFCRHCYQVGREHTVHGVACCEYCGSIHITPTSDPVTRRPEWKGGPGNTFFVWTRKSRGQE